MRDSNAVASLKEYYNDKDSPIDIQQLQHELLNATDRALVIILATFVDDGLEQLLSKKLRKLSLSDYKQIFKHDGPLGTFSVRIDMAYALGGIDEELKKRLHDLREMRNACAHSRRSISFEIQQLTNVTKRFLKASPFKMRRESINEMRVVLMAECFYLYNMFTGMNQQALGEMVLEFAKLSERLSLRER